MNPIEVVGVLLGAVLVVVGAVSGVRSLRETQPPAGSAFLVALHDAARAGFWITLGGAFVALSMLEPAEDFRWLVLIPIGMAGLRLVAATLLSRGD